MGEHEGCVEPGRSLPNGLLPGAGLVMQALDKDRWLKAEERTAELIACIQPNQLSEERRNAVADYVLRLIMKCIPCQVCTFGSVPLKTYLPDGDIDLTALTHSENLKDTCANQVRDMLENEERNENAEFHVKEVQYIQAEVKIIKCLVENIVVDISFNQVGGLCTLCFLDEVDNLINQNHLFKRSIILIKAWCYYESRILGAHHGLISTYALETLVLYIFHVFNNSFHGPLEVLYRFLEFFSNFDWNNFCVSLWGPVPISSLPDVTAQPPRKDSGELLLSKLFLDACSSVYAAGGQENNGQSFVSKHFNVIDPLRVNNNLGRSVSKGNFFRIRSAFAFGAKRLARLLDCPKENLVFVVNQFFFNTWERHGSGHRPDVREIDLWRSRLSPPDSSHEFENSKDDISRKKVNQNASVHGMERGGIRAHGDSSQHSKHSHVTVPRTSELSAASRTHTLKSQFNLNSLRDTNRIGREHTSNQVVSNDKIQTDKKADHLRNDIRRRSHFARTSSSPELTDAYGDMSSQVKHSRQMGISHSNANSARMDSGNKRNNFRFENLASRNSKSSVQDTSSMRHAPLHQTLDVADDSHSSFNSCERDLGLYSLSEELSSTSGAQEMNQEEQDIINMMASTSLQGRNEQIHFPFNLTSTCLPFPIPPSFLASMGYSQQNLPGNLRSSIPLIYPSFSNVPFPRGFVSPQLTHYFPGVGLSSLTEDVDAINDNFGSPEELDPVEVDNDFWQEQDVNSSGDHPENGNFELFHSGDKSPATLSGLKNVPPFRASASGSATKVQHKHAREKGESVQENSDNFPMKNSDFYAEERSASSRLSSATQSNSLRSRTSSESSWDGSSVKTSKSAKGKRGKKIFSVDVITGQGKGKMSERVAYQADDDEQEWGSSSQAETEMAERDLGPEPLASQLPRHHVPGFEIAQTSGSDSMIPITPVLLGPGSRHGMTDNSGMVAFYPTGPPITFFTMLRVYDVPPETGTSEASNGHFGVDETLDNSEFGQKFSSEGFGSSEELNSSSSLRGTATIETSEEHKSDILNSDFASHWQNLQFGRFCENARYHGPLAYSSPVMVPPGYLQDRFPDDNPNRPLVADPNLVSQLVANYGHCLVPVTPLPSVSSVPPNMYQRYMDDMPRHRSGTGTYLPNPKVSTRERQFSGTRRGNYNHDRNDNYSDREGNWNAYSKSRATAFAARNYKRSQIYRSNLRSDRLNTSESQTDRSWNSYRHDSIPFYQFQNGPFRSNPSQNSSQNVAYSMYPFAATHPNEVSNGPSVPPVMMLYPFDHNMTYGSHGEQLEFGTLGPAGFPGINEQSQLNERIPARAFEDHRLHGGSEHRSSPDEPSSPHYQR